MPKEPQCKNLKNYNFDSNLNFNEHYTGVIASASRAVGFLIRATRDFTNPNALIMLFYTLVRLRV